MQQRSSPTFQRNGLGVRIGASDHGKGGTAVLLFCPGLRRKLLGERTAENQRNAQNKHDTAGTEEPPQIDPHQC